MTKISLCMIVIFFIIVVSQGSRYRTNNRYYKYWKPQKQYNKALQQHHTPEHYYKEGEIVDIVCKEEEVIRVSYAKLKKRGRNSCHSGSCEPLQDVRNNCNGKRSCNFTVDTDFFGENCTFSKAHLVLQHKCIPDPCSTYCCANGGVCYLADPKGDNFNPTCMCVQFWEGKNCDDCYLNGTKFPCAWRNRTFNLYTVISPDDPIIIKFAANGTHFAPPQRPNELRELVVEIRGSFIILKGELADIYGYYCMKIDFNQSSKDRFVGRISGFSETSADPCILCSKGFWEERSNGIEVIFEAIAVDSDLIPTQSINNTFCDTPMGCETTSGVVCADNGSLDFNEGCP